MGGARRPPASSGSSPDRSEQVTLHSSWRGLISSVGGAVAVLGLGVLAVARGGWSPVSAVVVIVGLALAAVATLDYPVASTFDADGVTRRMMLRRQRMPWSSIDRLTRTRPGTVQSLRKLAHGGLVAVRGRRRYLLVDQCESLDEFRRVESVAVRDGDGRADVVPHPPDTMPPTWLHRRAKWAPTSHSGR